MARTTKQVLVAEWFAPEEPDRCDQPTAEPCPSCGALTCRPSDRESATDRRGPICLECRRAELALRRAPRHARQSPVTAEVRLQIPLFEPASGARLARLQTERAAARAETESGSGRFALRVRKAQIAARRALQSADPDTAAHAAELQLPEEWLPGVVGGSR